VRRLADPRWVGNSRRLPLHAHLAVRKVSITSPMRWTDRLKNRLLDDNHEVSGLSDEGAHDHFFREAAFDWQPRASEPTTTVSPTEFDFSMLNRLQEDDTGYHFYSVEGDNHSFWQDTPGTEVSYESGFDIMWVSTTEFVSRLVIQDDTQFVEHLYSISVHFTDPPLNLFAYRLLDHDRGKAPSEPPGRALSFLVHILAPILGFVKEITVNSAASCPVEASLQLVPTSAREMSKDIKMSFVNSSHEFLQALASHPTHRHVLLHLSGGISQAEMNVALREFRHPVHLQVPDKLLAFEGADDPFTANPAFRSLTIAESRNTNLSSKMLDNIAERNRIRQLTIVRSDPEPNYRTLAASLDWIIELLRCVVFHRSSRIQSLTLASQYNYFSSCYPAFTTQQIAFNKLSVGLTSHFPGNHTLSRFHWAFPTSQYKPPTHSNVLWDARFSPALVLNCFHRQQGGLLSNNISGLAIQRANQGVWYSHATNLVP
jgi:hypothetical protein